MYGHKDVLTTGEVAKICSVAPRTVSKWFDTGRLPGYRIPGSKDRRIPFSALVRFMKQHNIPLDSLSSGRTRVLIVESESDVLEMLMEAMEQGTNYEVRGAGGGFAAGIECEKFQPHVILLDAHLADANCRDVLRHIRANPALEMTKVIATSGRLSDGQAHQLMSTGFDGFLKKPFDTRRVVAAIEQAVALVY